jgi:hypothetical protein
MHQSTGRPLRPALCLQTRRIAARRPFQTRSHRRNQSRNRQKRITSPGAGAILRLNAAMPTTIFGSRLASRDRFFGNEEETTQKHSRTPFGTFVIRNFVFIVGAGERVAIIHSHSLPFRDLLSALRALKNRPYDLRSALLLTLHETRRSRAEGQTPLAFSCSLFRMSRNAFLASSFRLIDRTPREIP